MATIKKTFALTEAEAKTFDDFADKYSLSLIQAFRTLLDGIPLVEAELQKTTEPTPKVDSQNIASSDNTTGAAGFSTSPKPPNRDSPSSLPAAPDPIPLETSSSLKQTASTAISKTSDSGLSVGDNSKAISTPLLEKLRYQQLKAEIWQRTRIQTEKEIQAVREQVKRYHEADGRPTRVEMSPDKGKPDCGAPDFYEYERN